eukprot:TRINITY_DN21974_c0_g2_i4.p1 TRINITY_DN21974_c0_g2~~TRINITY_DN21974_c0_g2_i4.p1  ORF type:complete len:330 (+),score=-4.10 TRINITY_DN21974_c0_g2_i4:237-1226(+)
MKIDIKDYFMSGVHRSLVRPNAQATQRGEHYSDLLEHILIHQFVGIRSELDFFQVDVGSGMGLPFAGEVSDLAFSEMVESSWISKPEVQLAHNLVCYFRFKDDILLGIRGSNSERVRFWRQLKRKADFFKLQIESVAHAHSDRRWVSFLDVQVGFDKRWEACERIDMCPFRKATSVWRPLASRSCHPMSVHLSWPVTYCTQFASKSTSHILLRGFLVGFCGRFERCCPDHCALEKLKTIIQRIHPIPVHINAPLAPVLLVNSDELSTHIVLPYNGLWSGCGIQQSVRGIVEKWAYVFRLCNMTPVDIRVCWSLGGPHLGAALKAATRLQ